MGSSSLGFSYKVLRYLRDPAVATWRKAAAALSLLYVVSPVDVIPDIIPVVGWLDDLGVVGLAVAFVLREVRRHAKRVDTPSPSP